MIRNPNNKMYSVASLGLFTWLLLAIYGLAKILLASQRPKGFPPGPPTVPLLGNLHQLPRTKAFVQ
jgi:hypothetical protein